MTLALALAVVTALAASGWAAAAAKTKRVSVASGGGEADLGSSEASVSATGRFIAFSSAATNLVAGDGNGDEDIFVRDRRTGKTTRVSVGPGGVEANGDSSWPAISGGGRFVAFQSNATNLVPGDLNASRDVFVRDRKRHTTTRISVGSGEANSYSGAPSISADGRFVAFDSAASNLAPGDTNAALDVFVRDRRLHTTRRMSRNTAGFGGNAQSSYSAISADGRFVAYSSDATNLVLDDTNTKTDVFLRDRKTNKTTRVSVRSSGGQANDEGWYASLSGNGRYVAWDSNATNLVPGDSNATSDVFVRDRKTHKTRRVSVSSSGAQGNLSAYDAALSANGRFVAFTSNATNLVGGDLNLAADIFLRDRVTGKTKLLSVNSAGAHGNLNSGNSSISLDGHFVGFESQATNLVGGDTNFNYDIFIRGPL